ncbi:tetratricopeptide repeat protein [Sphingomonas daechungensis]|uniref:tetratricopeptide repeat protein n=1 Tax=Sphingomonas daechungensis TaxID=1176646 RepID=UPI003783FCE6
MIALLLSAALAAAKPVPAPAVQPPVPSLSEAAFAIQAGRLEQARLMIANAVKAGVAGPEIDRLLAELAYASGDYQGALPRYLPLLASKPSDGVMYEHAGIAAMKAGDVAQGAKLLDRATSFPTATWRAWNARGVAADYRGDWAVADESYTRATALAPDRAEVLNNYGWSLLARGNWNEALGKLERASTLDPKNPRIAANLELARAAVSEDLPQRRAGESEVDWAARLNDAGVIARLQGNNKKAVAAFTQAIEVRTQYYARAANNLAMAVPQK